MQRALVACGVASVAYNSEDGFVRALRVDCHEVADLHPASPSSIAAHNVVDLAGVEVAAWIALVVIRNISEAGLRDVIAGKRVFRPLQDGKVLAVCEVANNLSIGTVEIVRVD